MSKKDDLLYEILNDDYEEDIDNEADEFYEENNILGPGDSLLPRGTIIERYDPSDDY